MEGWSDGKNEGSRLESSKFEGSRLESSKFKS